MAHFLITLINHNFPKPMYGFFEEFTSWPCIQLGYWRHPPTKI